jgi:class 3 adenylate cyclase
MDPSVARRGRMQFAGAVLQSRTRRWEKYALHAELRRRPRNGNWRVKICNRGLRRCPWLYSFCRYRRVVDAAVFLKKFYTALLTDFLSEATFAKPTGDGLMTIFEYEESELPGKAKAVVEACIKIIEEYPEFLANDSMLIFSLPPLLGIGIARGAATRLASSNRILDYSGRCLNLSARLMDFARPRGIVLDATFSQGLTIDLDALGFTPDTVYIRGAADDSPRPILLRPDWSTIPDAARRPPVTYKWITKEFGHTTLEKLAQRGRYRFALDQRQAFPNELGFLVRHSLVTPTGRQSRTTQTRRQFSGEYANYLEDWEGHAAAVECARLAETLEAEGLKSTWPLEIAVVYRVVDGSAS